MGNQLKFDAEGRNSLKEGVDKLANAVKVTLGPKGKNVIIDREGGAPLVTKDGVTVAREIELTSDVVENIGVKMVKEVASKTADIAGDGTTTATVLAQAIIAEGIKMVTVGANPMDIKIGIDKAVELVVKKIKEQASPVTADSEQIKQIALVSANNDAEVAELIAKAIGQVGKDGMIHIDDASDNKTTVEVVSGVRFDRGWSNPYWANNPKTMAAEFKNPLFLVYDKKIESSSDLIPFMEYAIRIKKPIVIIAEGLAMEPFTTLMTNNFGPKKSLDCCFIEAPGIGARMKEALNDIALVTGATFISEDFGHKIKGITDPAAYLGTAESVVITNEHTTIVSGAGDRASVDTRQGEIKLLIDNTTDEREKERLKHRLAKLTGGIAVVYVGATTPTEMSEKKDRVDDAKCAVIAALDGGVIPGGGVVYIKSIPALDDLDGDNEDEKTGIKIIKKILEEPLRLIVNNGCKIEVSAVIAGVKGNDNKNWGFNARTEKFEDLVLAGIVDPAKVAITALENAASIAGMILTSACVVYNERDKK